MRNLSNKVVVITGASGDLGRALSLNLARDEHAKLWLTDLNADALNECREDLLSYTSQVHTAVCDVTDSDQLKQFADSIVEQEGQIDVWINNAGVSQKICPFDQVDRATFERILDVNLNGTIHGTRAALHIMQERGQGTIINISSVAGLVAAPYMSAYSTSKHAIVGFTRSLQTELALDHSLVKLMLVSPGFFQSRMVSGGSGHKFPEWAQWGLSTPEKVSREIIGGLKKGRSELICTSNGKLMTLMHTLLPQTTRKSAKVLLASSVKDILLNRYKL